MTYVLWDKVSPIYDVTAEQAKVNNPLFETEDSYVFYRDDGTIYDIIPISKLPEGETPEVRCDAYIEQLLSGTDEITAEEALEIIFGKRRLSRTAAVEISEILKGESADEGSS